MGNVEIVLTDYERKMLHTILLSLSAGHVAALGIGRDVFDCLALKFVALARDGKWPKS